MSVVIVEGHSDRVALETLAARRGLDLGDSGVAIAVLGGAQAIGRYLMQVAEGTRLSGLYDTGEERDIRRALERSGHGSDLTRDDLERLGFFACVADLEDELIRALGPDAVEDVLEANGDLRAFRTLQKQPEWRGRPVDLQLRRYMGSGGSRKLRYARLLVEALEPGAVPRPLERVLAHATA